MAKRGRKPIPEPLKILKGTRADRLNPSATSGNPARPECPFHLGDVAREEWYRMVTLLESMGVLSQTDGAALSLYCEAFSRWLKSRLAILREGFFVETAAGGVKTNPAVTILASAEAQMLKLLTEFGCTPSSRSQLKSGADKPQDALGEFLKSRKTK